MPQTDAVTPTTVGEAVRAYRARVEQGWAAMARAHQEERARPNSEWAATLATGIAFGAWLGDTDVPEGLEAVHEQLRDAVRDHIGAVTTMRLLRGQLDPAPLDVARAEPALVRAIGRVERVLERMRASAG